MRPIIPFRDRSPQPYTGKQARRRGRLLFVLGLVLSLCAASCGGEPRLVAPASPAPVGSTEPKVGATPRATPTTAKARDPIGEIIWTTAADPDTGAPTDALASYFTDAPELVACAELGALPPGASISATWDYNDTSLDAFDTTLSPTDPVSGRWITFHISRSQDVPWPVGVYEITIALDGVPVRHGTTEVVERD